MLVMSMEASFGDVSGPMRIAVPYYTMEPVLTSLLAQSSQPPSKPSKALAPKWHEIYDQIPVNVSVEWDAFSLTVRDLLNLEVNDVIEMNPDLISNSKVRIEDKTCFVGEIGLEGDQVAFQVNECTTAGLNLISKTYG